MLLATRDHLPLQDTCCAVKLCPRLCPNDDFGGGGPQQKGLKRLRRASATFSLGSPSEILLVGYLSGVLLHMAQPGQPAT